MSSSNESSIFFSRYPVVRGDSNTPSSGNTPFNNNDLEAPRASGPPSTRSALTPTSARTRTCTTLSGSRPHDMITITRGAGSTANVTVSAFDDNKYKKPV